MTEQFTIELSEHLRHRDEPLLKTDCRWCGQEKHVTDWAVEAYQAGLGGSRVTELEQELTALRSQVEELTRERDGIQHQEIAASQAEFDAERSLRIDMARGLYAEKARAEAAEQKLAAARQALEAAMTADGYDILAFVREALEALDSTS
jgi:exonuclease VII small subunit